MRKFTLLLLAIILIGAGAWGVMMLLDEEDTTPAQTTQQSTGEASEPAEEEDENQVTITYSDTGFAPSTVTVPVGTTVVFKNASNQSMWPASDEHPSHEIYSDFDSKKGFSKSQSYEFTFTKKGEWGYHNHLGPGDTGTIVVE